MKILLVGIGVIALILVIWSVLNKTPIDTSIKTETGDFDRFSELLGSVMESENEYAFVGINPEGTSEFFQITADKNSAQVDFPLITEGQKALSDTVEAVAKLNAFSVKETIGSDGSKFLDIELHGDRDEISGAVQLLLDGVFGDSNANKFELRYSGI